MAEEWPVQNPSAETTCCICLEHFKDPVMVDCGHTFCQACISQCCQKLGAEAACPLCREPVQRKNFRQLGKTKKHLAFLEKGREAVLSSKQHGKTESQNLLVPPRRAVVNQSGRVSLGGQEQATSGEADTQLNLNDGACNMTGGGGRRRLQEGAAQAREESLQPESLQMEDLRRWVLRLHSQVRAQMEKERMREVMEFIPEWTAGQEPLDFLVLFEQIMEDFQVPEQYFLRLLRPQVQDTEVQRVLADLPRGAGYSDFKDLLMVHFAFTPETLRRKFREAAWKPSESLREFAGRLSRRLRDWLQAEKVTTKEQLVELLLKERFYDNLSPELIMFIENKQPETVHQAARLGDETLSRRRFGLGRLKSEGVPRGVCFYCREAGHFKKDCPKLHQKNTAAACL